MAARIKESGKALRPHAKAHKCVEIAKRQVAAGAIGVCVATVAEAELMAAAGIPGLLLTSPVADPLKMSRAKSCQNRRDGGGRPSPAGRLVRRSRRARRVGNWTSWSTWMSAIIAPERARPRTPRRSPRPWIRPPIWSCAVFRLILCWDRTPEGWKSANASPGSPSRSPRGRSASCCGAGFRPRSSPEAAPGPGRSTRRFRISPNCRPDRTCSWTWPTGARAWTSRHALTVMATVVSANHPGFVTVDAGFKAFATDRGYGPEAVDLPGSKYRWGGDEFGYVDMADGLPKLGSRLEFIPPHCDPTTNLYDRIYACRGEQVEAVWPVKRASIREDL